MWKFRWWEHAKVLFEVNKEPIMHSRLWHYSCISPDVASEWSALVEGLRNASLQSWKLSRVTVSNCKTFLVSGVISISICNCMNFNLMEITMTWLKLFLRTFPPSTFLKTYWKFYRDSSRETLIIVKRELLLDWKLTFSTSDSLNFTFLCAIIRWYSSDKYSLISSSHRSIVSRPYTTRPRDVSRKLAGQTTGKICEMDGVSVGKEEI